MKKFLITIAIMLTVGMGVSLGQTVTDSWAFGFGFSYPRFSSVNVTSLNSNYGGYLSLQRNFSEHVGLRLKGSYLHIEGQWSDPVNNQVIEETSLITGDLDLLYYLVPCAPVSPYIYAGGGINYKTISNGQTVYPDDNKFGSHLTVGTGAEFKLNPNWSIVTEFGYHWTNNSELDGTIVSTELNGRDTYLVLSAGFNLFFGQGEPSEQCDPCQGITQEWRDMTDYDKIEDMIKNYIPKEVIKEVVVEKPIYAISEDRLVLEGVNFDFNKSDLRPESYPVLDKAVTLLKNSPDIRVEIQGYTDNIDTYDYNKKLSEERAQSVKNYLVSKGISENRLSTIGYSENFPIADNSTAEGRARNRRVVFRIIK